MDNVKFTEEMSRLILKIDNKQVKVGYKKISIQSKEVMICNGEQFNENRIVTEYAKSIHALWQEQPIAHTSFNKGIKVGDFWFFTGDIFQKKKEPCQEGILEYDDASGFYINIRHFKWELTCLYKKIGSIYEGGNDANSNSK